MTEKKDIAYYGKATRFSSENQPKNKNGRKKNRFKHLKGEYDLSHEDVSNIITYIVSLTPEEIKALMEDKNTPVIVSAYAAAAIGSIKRKDLAQIETMLNRTVGKPADTLNINDVSINRIPASQKVEDLDNVDDIDDKEVDE